MRRLVIIAFLASMACLAQQSPAPQDQSQQPPPGKGQAVIIPAGTRIPLALASPITNKGAKPGAPVRATTGFPVTVGTQVAIPTGAYVQGVIDHVKKSGSGGSLQMHFTRLIYPNGYTVMLDGTNVQAKADEGGSNTAQSAALAQTGVPTLGFAAQQSPPPLPPLPHSGPNTGLIVGGMVGTAAIAVLAIVLTGHHRAGNALLFDTGWQFDMVLQNPLVIDLGSAGITGAGGQ
jgi:type IV secretion system protein VirB10